MVSGEESASPVSEPCREPCRRRSWRMRKCACCMVILLLFFNGWFILTAVHYVNNIYFALTATFLEDNESLIPGGSKVFCSDLCVDLTYGKIDTRPDSETYGTIMYSGIGCNITDCLNACHSQIDPVEPAHAGYHHISTNT